MFGLVSIAVLDGVSEFIQLFPVMNALPAYVKAFVDRDLSWLVGIAYWYTFASTFAAQNLAAANLSRYWDLSQLWQTLAFYVFAPIVVLGINMFGVSIFGWIESVSGILKLALAFGTAVALYVAASVTKVGNSGRMSLMHMVNEKRFADILQLSTMVSSMTVTTLRIIPKLFGKS